MPVKTREEHEASRPPAPKFRPTVAVKFIDAVESPTTPDPHNAGSKPDQSSRLPYEMGAEAGFRGQDRQFWDGLAARFPGITLRPAFTAVSPDRLRELTAIATSIRAQRFTIAPRAMSHSDPDPPVERSKTGAAGRARMRLRRDPTRALPDLPAVKPGPAKPGQPAPPSEQPLARMLTYFIIETPPGVDPVELANALKGWGLVEHAEELDAPKLAANPLHDEQGYQFGGGKGIDAEYAWEYLGGDGEGIWLADIETAWGEHEDLSVAQMELIHGVNYGDPEHGTAVLGVIVAKDNDRGIMGIAPAARVFLSSTVGDDYLYAPEGDAIIAAINRLRFGDVLLIEHQRASDLPYEFKKIIFDSIQLATALGIIVVEAGGNGGYDLDTLPEFDLDVRDSDAIMVAGSMASQSHRPLKKDDVLQTNYGKRIDCYAWGEKVMTTGTFLLDELDDGTKTYTGRFRGTSSAAAIIAGAALSVQGVLKANNLPLLDSFHMRALLSKPAFGTPSSTLEHHIGVMPDLRTILEYFSGVDVDVFIRDVVNDAGDPRTSLESESPDIIVRPAPAEPDPDAAFGQASGTVNNDSLSSDVVPGQDHYVYVRVRNRGTLEAEDVKVSVYWTEASTAHTSSAWTLIGEATIPMVPVGNILTVSDAIAWPAAQIPNRTDLTLIALVGNRLDPAPRAEDFRDWDTFRRHVSTSNNVATRSVQTIVVDVPHAQTAPVHQDVEVTIAGAPEEARPMAIEFGGQLPEGTVCRLEGPVELLMSYYRRREFIPVEGDERRIMIALPMKGTVRIVEALIPASTRYSCVLHFQFPSGIYGRRAFVFLRQLDEEVVVGRVLWNIRAVRPGSGAEGMEKPAVKKTDSPTTSPVSEEEKPKR